MSFFYDLCTMSHIEMFLRKNFRGGNDIFQKIGVANVSGIALLGVGAGSRTVETVLPGLTDEQKLQFKFLCEHLLSECIATVPEPGLFILIFGALSIFTQAVGVFFVNKNITGKVFVTVSDTQWEDLLGEDDTTIAEAEKKRLTTFRTRMLDLDNLRKTSIDPPAAIAAAAATNAETTAGAQRRRKRSPSPAVNGFNLIGNQPLRANNTASTASPPIGSNLLRLRRCSVQECLGGSGITTAGAQVGAKVAFANTKADYADVLLFGEICSLPCRQNNLKEERYAVMSAVTGLQMHYCTLGLLYPEPEDKEDACTRAKATYRTNAKNAGFSV